MALTIDQKSFDNLDLEPVSKAAKALHMSKTKLYQILNKKPCPIDTYKPAGKRLVDMDSAKKWFLTTKVDSPKPVGAPRKR